MNNEGVDIN